jgi:hypothetical protein
MNLNKLIAIAIGFVIAFSAVRSASTFQTWIWRAQAKLLYESRTETWGSPRFFRDEVHNNETKLKKSKNRSSQL